MNFIGRHLSFVRPVKDFRDNRRYLFHPVDAEHGEPQRPELLCPFDLQGAWFPSRRFQLNEGSTPLGEKHEAVRKAISRRGEELISDAPGPADSLNELAFDVTLSQAMRLISSFMYCLIQSRPAS